MDSRRARPAGPSPARARSRGQCFLNSPTIVNEIVEALPLKGKNVLEIGGGHGELTAELADKAKNVRVIESDPELIPFLEKLARKKGNIEVVEGDALDEPFGEKTIFGNLPYYISTPLVMKILDSSFTSAVLMLQKEFGERMVAKPGSKNYSRLSVAVASRAVCETVAYVPAECFDPVPAVDSIVVKLTALPKSKQPNLDDALVRALFQHSGQNVRNALSHSARELGRDKKELREFADSTSYASTRVRDLSINALVELSAALRV
ncbi:ribosomal RNA small subunit methyltransferase A [Candidatus Micrarchaeota archaeon CG1_02_55_22]|nr:MAG: ribosomal RNA small subunit methyltransferase A [Candidatus Micrarchaeota archaeon CG1_02_55_22]